LVRSITRLAVAALSFWQSEVSAVRRTSLFNPMERSSLPDTVTLLPPLSRLGVSIWTVHSKAPLTTTECLSCLSPQMLGQRMGEPWRCKQTARLLRLALTEEDKHPTL